MRTGQKWQGKSTGMIVTLGTVGDNVTFTIDGGSGMSHFMSRQNFRRQYVHTYSPLHRD